MGFRVRLGNKFYTIRYLGGAARVYEGNPDKGAPEIVMFKDTYKAIDWAKKQLKDEILSPKKKKRKKS